MQDMGDELATEDEFRPGDSVRFVRDRPQTIGGWERDVPSMRDNAKPAVRKVPPLSPVRRRHLEWVRDHQPVALFPTDGSGPSLKQASKLLADGILEEAGKEPNRVLALTMLRLSAHGSQMLREAEADIGRDAVAHLKEMYPAALEAVPGSAAVSLRNFINSRVAVLLNGREEATR